MNEKKPLVELTQEKVYINGIEITDTNSWEKVIDTIKELQQENERLNNGYCELKVKCNNGEIDCTHEEYEGMIQANMKGALLLEDYKSRCEKAVEYIKNCPKYLWENVNTKELLNILNGKE